MFGREVGDAAVDCAPAVATSSAVLARNGSFIVADCNPARR